MVCLEVAEEKRGTLRRVCFSFPSVPGRRVALAGSFNDWDPDSAPMPYSPKDGRYSCTVMLPAGIAEYKFVVDGEWILDEENPDFAANDFGTLNSVVRVG